LPLDWVARLAENSWRTFAENWWITFGRILTVVTAIAVMEHLYNPFLAVNEIHRVLKQGGYFIGSVASLEPYHDLSYFHMTFLAVCRRSQRTNGKLQR